MTITSPRIGVILSTFNGTPWLREFMQSLVNQHGVSVEIIFRDDGSTDKSIQFVNETPLKKYECRCIGKQIGASESYMHLLEHVGSQDFIAFADQDDIWYPDKLKKATDVLIETKSSFYFSASTLSSTGSSWPERNLEFSGFTSCFENLAKGCTIVLAASGLNALGKKPKPISLVHDHWLFFMNLHQGRVIYDPIPRIIYRIHDGNAIGHKTMFNIKNSLKIFWILKRYLERCKLLLSISAELENQESANLLKEVKRQNSFRIIQTSFDKPLRGSRLLSIVIKVYLKISL